MELVWNCAERCAIFPGDICMDYLLTSLMGMAVSIVLIIVSFWVGQRFFKRFGKGDKNA